MLVLRTDLSGDPSFAELLARVRETALAAFAHQDLPFERLVEELNPERRMSVTPIFQVAFSLQNYPAPELALADLELALEVEDLTINAKIDLNLIMQRSPRGLEASFVYDADLWNADTVQAWADHLTALADRIAADPGVMLAALRQALSDADRERRLEQQQRFENARARGLGRLKRPQAPAAPFADTRDPHAQR
jgi:non-ribosomal peptide synthetase component F